MELTPYKGPESYEVEDEDLFFGRDREADQLLARILSSRCTLLHAQSGAGKTSLLNARIVPGLEQRGWTPVRVLPQNNPTESVRVTTLETVLPPVHAERRALERAAAALFPNGRQPTLGELLREYDALAPGAGRRDAGGAAGRLPDSERARLRRELLAPIAAEAAAERAVLPQSGLSKPLFFRLLRGTLSLRQYAEHLAAIAQAQGTARGPGLTENSPASALAEELADPAWESARQRLLADLYVPVPDLWAFFDNLFAVYGARVGQFCMVLLLDQFEELFTRFTDAPGDCKASHPQAWRLRWSFLDQLAQLYAPELRPSPPGPATPPLRFVISMRDEYIAQLDALRRFVPDLDASAFHLSFLEKEQARIAVQQPARRFGYDYSEDVYADMLRHLVREDRFVEPAQMQIVCYKLWRLRGRELAASAVQAAAAPGGGGGHQVRMLGMDALPEGGTKAILDSFFSEFLEALPEADRLETLEMLESLVTASGTRNIVERRLLIEAPFRDPIRRDRLLGALAKGKIVRVEMRLGGEFVEITHEFLIDAVLEKLRLVLNGNAEYSRFRWALRTLERSRDIDFKRDARNLLPREVFAVLDQNVERVQWNRWSVELMFRTAIADGAERKPLAAWARRFAESGEIRDGAAILRDRWAQEESRRFTLSSEELAAVNAKRELLDLNPEQIEFVFRCQILRGSEAADVRYWTERLKQCQVNATLC